jgi:hypothetical protein
MPLVRAVAGALLKRRALAHEDILALLVRPARGRQAATRRPQSRRA